MRTLDVSLKIGKVKKNNCTSSSNVRIQRQLEDHGTVLPPEMLKFGVIPKWFSAQTLVHLNIYNFFFLLLRIQGIHVS